MSVLETPRIYFRGQVTWDPIVTNNDDKNYDEETGETIYPNSSGSGAGADAKVKAFREAAIGQVTARGNWNPQGTHRAAFFDTAVSGFDLGCGIQTKDAFVAAGVNLQAMLVDLEPFGGYTSQLFFDSMRFGVDGGYRIFAPRTSRFTARYINFSRNTRINPKDNPAIAGVASVIWQTSFAKSDGLRIDAFDSAALKGLEGTLLSNDVLGLTVRFNAYRTIYYENPDLTNGSDDYKTAAKGLQKKLMNGGFQPNPARSLLVGVIGLWRKGESAHEPGDRVLSGSNPSIGAAYARISDKSIMLDLSNSVSEVDKDLTKKDLGPLTLVAVDPATLGVTNLGTLPYSAYNRAAYEASAGIVTLPLGAHSADLAAKDLQLRDATGQPLLSELALRAIPATPNLYLDEGGNATATFQVYSRGVAATSAIQVTLYKVDASGQTPDNGIQLSTDASGVLSVPIPTTAEGIAAYVPSFNAVDKPSDGINPLVNNYMYVRIRPSDSALAQTAPTWQNVYSKVLANWNAMAPCMDNWLKLNDPVQVKAYAAILKMLTDPARFESFRYMPVTRDMSAGERALLYKFLDATDATSLTGGLQSALKELSHAALSRSMRRG